MEFDWVGLWVFLVYILSVSVLSFLLIRQNHQSAIVKANLAQALADRSILTDKLQKVREQGGVADSETFIKYLSSSRESAYEYIGDVQDKIKNLIVAWNYHTTIMPPDGSSEKKLYDAYAALVAMLPKDTGND